MGKLAALYVLVALVARVLYRRNPRVRRRLNLWFVLLAGMLLLFLVPWGPSGTPLDWARPAAVLVLLAILVADIYRTFR